MAITIPNRKAVRPTTDSIHPKPNTAKSGVANPCPVGIATTGASSSGTALVEPVTAAGRDRYIGYNIRSNVPDGGIDDEAFAPISGCPVEGFAGVSPGVPVWLDDTARPDPEADFSGLTHTDPADGTLPVGIGWTTTKIYFYAI